MTNITDEISVDEGGRIVIGAAPPADSRSGVRGRPSPLMEAADNHPGTWVSLVYTARVACTNYRKKGYEATVRKNGDGTWTLYLRKPAPGAKP